MRPYPGEPSPSHWESLTDDELAQRLNGLLPSTAKALILVDGRSGAGKSTLAGLLAELLGGSMAHSDDVAWHHDPFDWADLLVEGVIEPWNRGEPVSYRPPGWVAKGREGAVEVVPRRVLVVEGVGVGRPSLAHGADLLFWVQSDRDEARRRGIERDISLGRKPLEAREFWAEWMRAEEPFLEQDRPWTRAALIVNGTPPLSSRDRTLIAPGPLT